MQCASHKSSSLWRRPLAMQKRPAMTLSQPPSGRKSMCRKSNLRLTSWLFWQIRSLRGSFMPYLKSISHLNVLRHIFVLRREVIKCFPLPILESPSIGAEPPARSLHNVGSDPRRPAIFLQAVQVKTNPDRQLSSKTRLLY